MTPNIAVVHFANPYWRSFRLWLPLFLLWIPAGLLAPLLLPLLVLACVAARVSWTRTLRTIWGILSGLSGTEVSFNLQANRIHVRIL